METVFWGAQASVLGLALRLSEPNGRQDQGTGEGLGCRGNDKKQEEIWANMTALSVTFHQQSGANLGGMTEYRGLDVVWGGGGCWDRNTGTGGSTGGRGGIKHYFLIVFGHDGQKPLELRTEEEVECDEWVEAIQQARYP
ncbi:hypothetical protein JZ751_001076 [Albula glossodonta]|uniref:PH domain-containing protein n=1 Tax=Albula glossodonta TaxID=121402 RepID=A0A8T2PSR9_9TELE|nr:hypothetical protein JZ751_001076 [Albula glossodonta]